MTKETSIKLFESKKIRVNWDTESEKWYFSVIDIIETLTGSNNPRRYWSDLKRKLTKEGFTQLYEIIVQLKLESSDGKRYVTDCADGYFGSNCASDFGWLVPMISVQTVPILKILA